MYKYTYATPVTDGNELNGTLGLDQAVTDQSVSVALHVLIGCDSVSSVNIVRTGKHHHIMGSPQQFKTQNIGKYSVVSRTLANTQLYQQGWRNTRQDSSANCVMPLIKRVT